MFTFTEVLIIASFTFMIGSVFTFAYIIHGTNPKKKRRAFNYEKDK